MNTNTYDKIVTAAHRLNTDDTKDTWALADAVLDHVPDGSSNQGGDRRSAAATMTPLAGVDDRLASLSSQMKSDGIVTPNGDPYTVSALRHLRDTAMAWSGNDRHPEAAYRTHQEAGSPTTLGGKALAGLAAIARGEDVRRPNGVQSKPWQDAVARVQARKKGFQVAANDVRVALERKINVPTRNSSGGGAATPTTADVKAALTKGTLDIQDVGEHMSDAQVTDLFRKRRAQRIQEDVDDRHADMTDAEYAESERDLEELQMGADALMGAANDLADDATGGPLMRSLVRLYDTSVTTLGLARNHNLTHTVDQETALYRLDETYHVLDLIKMALNGQTMSAEDKQFLAALGITA